MRINENNYSTLKRASEITGEDYDIKWFDAENFDGYIDTDELISIIDDLIYEVGRLEERLEDLEEDIRDNYKRIPISEQVGINDDDFI